MNASNDRYEFLPLMAPRIDTGTPKVAIDWFRELAEQLVTLDPVPKATTPRSPQHDDGRAQSLTFRSVEDIAKDQRDLDMLGRPEPPEIARLRNTAQQAAQDMLSSAYGKARAIEEEAQVRGNAAGYQAGYQEGLRRAELDVHARADIERGAYQEDIAAFIGHIEAERQRVWNELEPQMIGLVFELASYVIKQEVEANKTVVLSVVRNALRRVADSGTLRIRVNAGDLETVRGNREELLTLVDNIRHVEIIEDRRVGAGGCIVETGAGNIDARIETQIADVADTLNRIVAHEEK